jgi:hypothetical protein
MKQLNPKIKADKNWSELNHETHCHVDPDIYTSVIPRKKGWKAVFGQIDAAQSHLNNNNVQVGDIFLFFGWFQKTNFIGNKLVFDRADKGKHIIFGYLEIGQIIYPQKETELPEWIKSHPHLRYGSRAYGSSNTLYIAQERLSWNAKYQGWGTFNFKEDLVLTKTGCYTRSQWDLPEIFRGKDISYHSAKSWKSNYFQSAARGQEFIVNCTQEIEDWTKKLICQHAVN